MARISRMTLYLWTSTTLLSILFFLLSCFRLLICNQRLHCHQIELRRIVSTSYQRPSKYKVKIWTSESSAVMGGSAEHTVTFARDWTPPLSLPTFTKCTTGVMDAYTCTHCEISDLNKIHSHPANICWQILHILFTNMRLSQSQVWRISKE